MLYRQERTCDRNRNNYKLYEVEKNHVPNFINSLTKVLRGQSYIFPSFVVL
jgi:hypothetical protein